MANVAFVAVAVEILLSESHKRWNMSHQNVKKADIVLIIQHISPLEGFIVLLIYYLKIVYN